MLTTPSWYRFEPATGMWRHAAGSPEPPLSLHDVTFSEQGVSYPAHRHRAGDEALAGHLEEAARILSDPVAVLGGAPVSEGPPLVGDDFETLRWFWLPDEVRDAVEAR